MISRDGIVLSDASPNKDHPQTTIVEHLSHCSIRVVVVSPMSCHVIQLPQASGQLIRFSDLFRSFGIFSIIIPSNPSDKKWNFFKNSQYLNFTSVI